MIKEESKRGSMSAKQLVTIILLIAGFAIIFLIFYQINWTGQIDREICHQSVVFRATLPAIGQELVPLKCQTSKVCITSGLIGGKCEADFENVKSITKAKVNDLKQVEKLISQEVIDCWSMMGEGKVSLFSQYWAETFGVGGVYPTCVICSRIAFDEKLDLELKDMDVLKYMRTHKIPNGDVSYYKYLAEEGGTISVDNDLIKVKEIVEVEGEEPFGVNEEDIVEIFSDAGWKEKWEDPLQEDPKGELAILFMQISAPTHKDAALNLGNAALGIGIGGSFVAPSLVMKGVKAVGLKGGLVTLAVAIVGAGAQQISVAHSRGVTAGYCGDISVGKDARNGCSVVRVVNYNSAEISQYCSVIESIP